MEQRQNDFMIQIGFENWIIKSFCLCSTTDGTFFATSIPRVDVTHWPWVCLWVISYQYHLTYNNISTIPTRRLLEVQAMESGSNVRYPGKAPLCPIYDHDRTIGYKKAAKQNVALQLWSSGSSFLPSAWWCVRWLEFVVYLTFQSIGRGGLEFGEENSRLPLGARVFQEASKRVL